MARRERSCDWREEQLEAQRLRLEEKDQSFDSRHEALELLASASQPQTPIRAKPRPGRNQACWCDSKKKYKNCHLKWDQTRDN